MRTLKVSMVTIVRGKSRTDKFENCLQLLLSPSSIFPIMNCWIFLFKNPPAKSSSTSLQKKNKQNIIAFYGPTYRWACHNQKDCGIKIIILPLHINVKLTNIDNLYNACSLCHCNIFTWAFLAKPRSYEAKVKLNKILDAISISLFFRFFTQFFSEFFPD